MNLVNAYPEKYIHTYLHFLNLYTLYTCPTYTARQQSKTLYTIRKYSKHKFDIKLVHNVYKYSLVSFRRAYSSITNHTNHFRSISPVLLCGGGMSLYSLCALTVFVYLYFNASIHKSKKRININLMVSQAAAAAPFSNWTLIIRYIGR